MRSSHYEWSPADNDATCTAHDPTRSLWVTVGHSRVLAVRLSTQWRAKVGPDRLATTLVEVSNTAAFELAGARTPPGLSDDAPDIFGQFRAAFDLMTPEESTEAEYRTAELLATVLAEASARADRIAGMRDLQFSGADERRRVEVTLSALGMLGTVRIDERWLASVTTERLMAVINEALSAANLMLEEALQQAMGAESPSQQLFREINARHGSLLSWLQQEGQDDRA